MTKRKIYIITAILFSCSALAARADSATAESKLGGNPYKLAMSKNDKLCAHMLQMLNSDIQKYGYEKYDEHKEFSAIPWQEARFSTEHRGRITYMPVKGASFDFNNDGLVEFVVKLGGSLGGRPVDSVYVLDNKASTRAQELANTELFESKNQINLSGDFYRLQPPFGVIGGVRVLEPVLYEGTAYLYMRPLFDASLAKGEREYSIIVRYRGGRFVGRDHSGTMDDVCYFEHARDVRRPRD